MRHTKFIITELILISLLLFVSTTNIDLYDNGAALFYLFFFFSLIGGFWALVMPAIYTINVVHRNKKEGGNIDELRVLIYGTLVFYTLIVVLAVAKGWLSP